MSNLHVLCDNNPLLPDTDTMSPNFVYEYPGDRTQLEEELEDREIQVVEKQLTIDTLSAVTVGAKRYCLSPL